MNKKILKKIHYLEPGNIYIYTCMCMYIHKKTREYGITLKYITQLV